MTTDWVRWHADYEDPESPLSRRLAQVQGRIRVALNEAPPGPVTVLSMCAGQGRDLLGVLADHPRGADVRARLVELDPELVAAARTAAREGVQTVAAAGIEVVEADAGLVSAYAGMAPAQIVLACGVFGNVSDADVRETVRFCGQLTRPGGTVIWTRHRREPDLVPAICDWFAEEGFEPVGITDEALGFGVGAHRLLRHPEPLETAARMFTFTR